MKQISDDIMSARSKVPEVAILVDTATGWGRRVVRGILSYAEEVGPWHVFVRASGRNESLQLPVGWSGDGVIARVSNSDMATKLSATGVPIVNVSGIEVDGFSAPCVTTDYDEVANTAIEHFLDRGFRNFAYIGPIHESFVSRHHSSYQRALEARGLPCQAFDADVNIDDPQAVRDSVAKWVSSLTYPVGVFTWGASVGREVVEACLREKVTIPYDVAVLGGDFDELLSEACYPALSGVVTSAEMIGYTAAQRLHQMIQGEAVPHETTALAPVGVEQRLSTDVIAVDDPKIVQVVAYLREHACEQISVADILEAVPMSRRILEKRFRKYFGRSILAEIRRLRVDKARRLLSETDMQMQEIAEACGFSTYNYLTHIFKQVAGQTPSSYRKQWRVK